MANWEQIRASSFSLIFRPMGRLKMFSFFSRTSSSLDDNGYGLPQAAGGLELVIGPDDAGYSRSVPGLALVTVCGLACLRSFRAGFYAITRLLWC